MGYELRQLFFKYSRTVILKLAFKKGSTEEGGAKNFRCLEIYVLPTTTMLLTNRYLPL